MKKGFTRRSILLLLVLAMFPAGGCAAGAHRWTRADTVREAAFAGLEAVDWGQTRNIAKHPEKWTEVNPILGKHPTVGEVDRYFAASLLAHAAVSAALPNPWRKRWQYLTSGFEMIMIGNNLAIGIRMDW